MEMTAEGSEEDRRDKEEHQPILLTQKRVGVLGRAVLVPD